MSQASERTVKNGSVSSEMTLLLRNMCELGRSLPVASRRDFALWIDRWDLDLGSRALDCNIALAESVFVGTETKSEVASESESKSESNSAKRQSDRK